MADTPIENRYPWLSVDENGPKLPENPKPEDFARAYGTMLMVYQSQRSGIVQVMELHREERREVLEVLKTIRLHQTGPLAMPWWAKLHSLALFVQAVAIAWLLYAVLAEQRIVERLVSFHN